MAKINKVRMMRVRMQQNEGAVEDLHVAPHYTPPLQSFCSDKYQHARGRPSWNCKMQRSH